MSCHVPAAVLINLDGRRLSCHHWTHVDVVAIWSLCGFYMASQCCRHLLKQPRRLGSIGSGTPWLVPVAVMSAVQGPSEHPAQHAAAFSRTGCAVHPTQTPLTQMTIQRGSQSCPTWCPRTSSHQAFPSQLIPGILLAGPFNASD